jgi:hypothetical protein
MSYDATDFIIYVAVVPGVLTAIACAFCIVYRHVFNRPLLDDGTPTQRSAAWDRPHGADAPAGRESNRNNWGYQTPTGRSPYAVPEHLSGRVHVLGTTGNP